jgi:hypothetical protein
MGYHVAEIPKALFGTPAKIKEEFLEFEDAITQDNPVMALLELSDLLGAIEGYLEFEYHNRIKLYHLSVMKDATKRAFETGGRN